MGNRLNQARVSSKYQRRVLIINRGAIALRAVQACHDLELTAGLLCSTSESTSRAALLAHESLVVPGDNEVAVYLDQEAIIRLARTRHFGTIYPGYGFLAEDASFARKCEEAGLLFVGPNSAVLAELGDKLQAKALAQKCRVPVVDGSERITSLKMALAEARRLGYPLMLKAEFGGGGRGIRRVTDDDQLIGAFKSASLEARSAFGKSEIYLEKCLEQVRHIEVQVAGARGGQVIALGERECSIQRRHQKLIEEAPSVNLKGLMRRELYLGAIRMMKSVGLTGLATVEFLVEPRTGMYYFLEVNPRVQVEHGITEAVTGLDLVKLQFEIAFGKPLPIAKTPAVHGHAIECRLYAEDPLVQGQSVHGVLTALEMPCGVYVSHATGARVGNSVTGQFDPLIAKIITWGSKREDALARMKRALKETRIEGVMTNRALLELIVGSRDFGCGETGTAWLEKELPSLMKKMIQLRSVPETNSPVTDQDQALAALVTQIYQALQKESSHEIHEPWNAAARRGR